LSILGSRYYVQNVKCSRIFLDTLFASGYEVYDRLSKPYQKFLEGLTATYAQPRFNEVAGRNNFKIHTGPRGAPENVGEELSAEHPVIRTNPVTGWKSVFAVGTHVQKINDLAEEESKHLLNWFVNLIVENHDLQVRQRWQNPNDLGKKLPLYMAEFEMLIKNIKLFGITDRCTMRQHGIMRILALVEVIVRLA